MAMTGKTYVDGKDIYAGYGVYITSGGWNGLVAMPPLKTPESNDWQEEDGVEVDLTAPVLDTREFTVTFACAPDASRMADFIALLSDGAYHTFRCYWIGRTYTLRMVSQSKLSYNPALGTFSLKMADDFPLDGYTYAAPESGIPEHDDYLLDGTPMTDYGVRVLSGTLSNVLSMPDVKTALLRNVSVLAGAEYDPETVTFKSKDVKVQCLMRAGTLKGLWRNWDALLYDLVRAGARTLYCADAGRAFPCFYKSCSVSSFSPGERPWLQFALTLTFTYDTRMDYVLFRIEPTPADAAVTINGRSVTFVMVSPGTEVEWTVEREGYVTASGSQTVTEGTVLPVELERETYAVTFRVSPADAIVTVNGTAYTPDSGGAVTVYAQWGDVLEWSVSRDGYGTRSGSLTVKGNSTVDVVLIDAGSIISEMTYDDIPAGGGTVLPKMSAVEGAVLTYSGTGVNATTGAVSADSLGTTVKARARVTTVTVTAEYGGAAASASCTVYQEENKVERTDTVSETRGAVSVSLSYGKDIPAGGGSVTPDLEYSQTVTGRYTDTYTSGATETRSGSFTVTTGAGVTYSGATDSSTGAVSAGSLGTTVRERTLLATVAVTVTLNGETASASAGVWQEANKVESTTDEDTYSDIAITGGFEYDDIGAGGGSVTPTAVTYSQTHTTGHSETYTSGEVKSDGTTETLTSGGEVSYSGTGVNTSTGSVSADSLGTTVKARAKLTTATATVTLNGKSNSVDADVYQGENRVESTADNTTYSTPTRTSGGTYDDIPAWGGTVYPSEYKYSQTKTTTTTTTYTSGESTTSTSSSTITSGGTVTYEGADDSSTGAVTADSLGTTVKARTLVRDVTIRVSLNGKASASYGATVYQQENKVESTADEETYGTPSVSLSYEVDGVVGADIPAGGGTATPALSYSQTHTTGHSETYTSGEVATDGTTETITTGAEVSYGSEYGYPGAIDPSTGAVSADSLGTTVQERSISAAVTATVTMNGKSGTAAATVWQQENKVETTGEEVGYEDLIIRLTYSVDGVAGADIPAWGGTATPDLSYSQEWHTYATYTYTSGATSSEKTGDGTDTGGGDVAWSGEGVDTSTGAVTAPSLGTTVRERTMAAEALATVTLNGVTDAALCRVYQQENKVESESSETTYSVPSVSLSYEVDGVVGADIPAGGGTARPVLGYRQLRTWGHTVTYTSGEITTDGGDEYIENTGGTVTYGGDGVASDGAVSGSHLGTTVKARTKVATSTVTVEMNDKSGTATAAVYQQENKVESTEEDVAYGEVDVLKFSYPEIPASGGTVLPDLSYRQEVFAVTTRTYTSGATDSSTSEAGYVTDGGTPEFYAGADDEATGAVTAPSLGTEERNRTVVTTVIMYVAGRDGRVSGTFPAYVYQEKNKVESTTVSRDVERLRVMQFIYPDIPGAGGTVYPETWFWYEYEDFVTDTYTSGESRTEGNGTADVVVTPDELMFADNTMKFSPITLDTATGAATAGAATSTERQSLTTVTMSATYTSPTGAELTAFATADVYQEPREAWLRVDPDSLSFGADGGSAQVEVDSSTSDFSVDGISGIWLSVRKAATMGGERSLEVTAASNTSGNVRTGSVTLSNDDGCVTEVAVEQEAGGVVVNHTLTVNISLSSLAQGGGTTATPTLRLTCGGVTETVLLISGSVGATEWSWSGEYEDGSVVSYEVSMDGYATVTGSVTMDEDKTVNVTMREA